jgi:hypothetical protein
VTNNSTTGARINGYALVADNSTGDAFPIVQVGPTTDPMFMPAFEAADTFLHLTNSSSVPITVNVTTVSSGPRRRSVKGSSIGSDAASVQTIAPFGYASVPIAGSGFVRVTGSTAVRASGRFSSAGIGSGLAVLPTSRTSKTRTFGAVEDAGPATVAAARKLSYRTNLMLVETTGNDATVTLTLHYVFSSGKVSSPRSSSRTFLVPAGRYALIEDLARSIIGPSRDGFGDLHHATLDIEVTAGSGSVMPFLQVIDNGTGDMTVRHE